MKNLGRAFGTVNRMNRGQDAFDAAKATEAFHTISANAKTFSTLFPDSSKEGDKNARPEIWTQKADFDARVKKLAADAEAAALATAKGEAAFKTAFATVQPQCGGCHQVYRND